MSDSDGEVSDEINQLPPCRFYARGECRNGNNCKFPHDDDNNSFVEPTPICKFYSKKSGCRNGSICNFRHINADGKATSHLKKTITSNRKTKLQSNNNNILCRHYLRPHGCEYGRSCRFLHKFVPVVGKLYRVDYLSIHDVDIEGDRCVCGNELTSDMYCTLLYCDHWICDYNCDRYTCTRRNGEEIEVCMICRSNYD